MFIRVFNLTRNRVLKAPQSHLKFMFTQKGQHSNKFDINKNYYNILQVNKEASNNQINEAFSRLAGLYYSDSDKGIGSRYGDISEAYRVLSDIKLREEYNNYQKLNKFDQFMDSAWKTNSTSQPPKQTSGKLTPQEEEYYKKFNTYLKRFILVIAAYFMFSPFFFWQGKQQSPQEMMQDPNFGKRRGGMYFNRNAGRGDGQSGQPEGQNWNPQGMVVTGQIVQE